MLSIYTFSVAISYIHCYMKRCIFLVNELKIALCNLFVRSLFVCFFLSLVFVFFFHFSVSFFFLFFIDFLAYLFIFTFRAS